jgi:hypothetical protein
VLIACWSVKGGVGTTVVAAALASSLASSHADVGGSLLVDLAGDLPAALGLPEPGDPGLTGWTRAGADVAADALGRLELAAAPGVSFLPRGRGLPGSAGRHEVLAGLLAADPRPVVVDAGVVAAGDPCVPLVAGATRSLLVTRACYLGLRRVSRAPVRPSGVVLVSEPGRMLSRQDIEHSAGAPIVADIPYDPAVARAVDSGLLVGRIPRSLARPLRAAA